MNTFTPFNFHKDDKLYSLWMVHRAALIQQAKGLEEQRRAILSEVGEIDKILKLEKKVEDKQANANYS